jgi:nicotinamidase-related amidase
MSRVLNREDAVLVVIDIQERLVPTMEKESYSRLQRNFKIAIEAAGTMGLPMIVTEQYPKGLGRTVPEVLQALEGKTYDRIEKIAFSCARDEGFLVAMAKTARRQAILIGIEAHVCVYQTAIDLTNAGYEVFVLDDAVSSRSLENYQSALVSMRDGGVVVLGTEAAVFQMLKVSGTPEFKKISSLLR